MSWRTVVIDSKSKLTYKNGYLIVRSDEVHMIHLSEINTILISSTAVAITSYLVNELLSRKIKIVFCDEKTKPVGEVVSYYGCHNSSKRVRQQINWDYDYAKEVWTAIIKEKIKNQAKLLENYDEDGSKKLYKYVDQIRLFDSTNREGHAAKVYFDDLFGIDFTRTSKSDINASLNYGYSVLLSQFNKELVLNGYLTQLGIKHCNEFNPFNLSSDLMEPFRPLVDKIVRENCDEIFDGSMRLKLVDVLNHKVRIKNSNQYVTNAISIYVKSVIKAIEKKDISYLEFFEYEL